MKPRRLGIEKELTGQEHCLLVQANIKIVTLESDLFWFKCGFYTMVIVSIITMTITSGIFK